MKTKKLNTKQRLIPKSSTGWYIPSLNAWTSCCLYFCLTLRMSATWMVTTYHSHNSYCSLNTCYAPVSVLAAFHTLSSTDRDPTKITVLNRRKRRRREIVLLASVTWFESGGVQAQLYLSLKPLIFSRPTVLKAYICSLLSFRWRCITLQLVQMFRNGVDVAIQCLVLRNEFWGS